MAGSNARLRDQKRDNLANVIVDPSVDVNTLLSTIKDPAKRAQMQMEIALAERDEERDLERLVTGLVRERSSVKLCPAPTKNGPCNKILLGMQVYCKSHWGSATRVSTKLLPDERDEILAERKRARTGSNQEILLNTLVAESSKRARPSEFAEPGASNRAHSE